MIFWNKKQDIKKSISDFLTWDSKEKKKQNNKSFPRKTITQLPNRQSTLGRKQNIIPQHKIPEIPTVDNRDILEEKAKTNSSQSVKSSQNSNKDFLRIFEQLSSERHRPWDIWKDFIMMSACAISNAVDKSHFTEREEQYLDIIKKYNKQEQELFPKLLANTVMALDENPEQDFLGHIYMSLNFGNEHKGQFFTPYHVCELMAQITMENVIRGVKENGFVTINDPCCGAGATLIAAVQVARKQLEKENLSFQNHILVVAQDIDITVALMCYIQLSLLGVAGYIKVGNSLTEPIIKNDSTENYWYTPMYLSPAWLTRRIFYNEKGKVPWQE